MNVSIIRWIIVCVALAGSNALLAQQNPCKGVPNSTEVIGYGGCIFYGQSIIAGTYMEAATTVTAGSGVVANGRVQNVESGIALTDAVNVSQLDQQYAYINQKYAYLNQQSAYNRSVAGTGVAIAMAAASVPALEAGKNFGFGLGAGTYDGRSAISIVGIARVSQSVQVKFNIGTGPDGRSAAGAGALMSW